MTDKYPLSDTLTGRERDILTQKKIGEARLGYAQDTGKLMFYEGTKWVGAQSEYVTQWSSSSSTSSSSSQSSSMSSSSSRSSSSSSSSMSSSSMSSSSSAKRSIYPVNPIIAQTIKPEVDDSKLNIYTVINIEANISQVFNMDVGLFEIELTGLSVYTGGLDDLTTQGNYIPLEGSYAFSVGTTTVEPEFMMSLASKFITSLESVSKVITIKDKDYQRILFNKPPQAHVLDQTVTLDATTTAGLPVSYTSGDTAIATVSGNILNILDSGSVNITADQAGNADYEAAESVTQTFKIKPRIIVRQETTTSGETGVRVTMPVSKYTDFAISYWLKPTLPTDPNDFGIYYGDWRGYFHRIYGDGSGINQDPSMGGPALGVLGRGNGSPLHSDKFSHLINPGTFTSGEWHHVVWKRSMIDAQVSLHINGVRKNTTATGLTISGLTDPAYNGNYIAVNMGQTHAVYTTDDKNGTPTWKSLSNVTDPENILYINGKTWYQKQPANGQYRSDSAIFWDDVNNRWVLTDSPESNLPGSAGYVGTSPFASHVVNEVNATKVMYADKLAFGFNQGTNGWAAEDTGLVINNTIGSPLMFDNPIPDYTAAEIRAGANLDDYTMRNYSPSIATKYISPGGGYSTVACNYPRDITEVAIWKYVDLSDDDITTIYNQGHSNSKEPNPTILNLKGGPTSYYRGGMDDFVMGRTIRNVGSDAPANQIVDNMAQIYTNANLIKYEP